MVNGKDLNNSHSVNTQSSSQNPNYTLKTTEKFYKILDFFDKNDKRNDQISPSKDFLIAKRLKISKHLNELKTQFVCPQTIISDANLKYNQEKLMKSTINTTNEEFENKCENNKKGKSKIQICIRKTNLEKIRPKITRNEYIFDNS